MLQIYFDSLSEIVFYATIIWEFLSKKIKREWWKKNY